MVPRLGQELSSTYTPGARAAAEPSDIEVKPLQRREPGGPSPPRDSPPGSNP